MTGTALVLGGGGVTGAAWELGLLAGLADAGVDLTDAELVVGTSAGAIVGAQITSGAALAELYRAQLSPAQEKPPPKLGLRLTAQWARAAASSRDPVRVRARLGALALAAKTVSAQERLAMIAARLPCREWPSRRLLITAVDADSGEFATFSAENGVELATAVAASCAAPCVWPVICAAGRRWIDGGVRSPANADLAAGARQVVVIAPVPRGLSGGDVSSQVAALAGDGASVTAILPDRSAARFMGRNGLNPSLRAPAARAGYAQASAVFQQAAAVWAGTG